MHYCPFGGLLLLSLSLKGSLGTPCWQDECLLRLCWKLKIQFTSMHMSFYGRRTKTGLSSLLGWFWSSSGPFHGWFLLLRGSPSFYLLLRLCLLSRSELCLDFHREDKQTTTSPADSWQLVPPASESLIPGVQQSLVTSI